MKSYKIGLDIGSTTIKIAVLDEENNIVFSKYKRHLSDIKSNIVSIIMDSYQILNNEMCTVCITGSGGLSVSEWLGFDFVQEVIACSETVKLVIPQTDVVIELGGEDAKVTYFRGGLEQRMNSSCAGGTGAFIDQMATLLNTDAKGLNDFAKNHKVIYPIASRCGVFAKTDIQPLINDGASKEDIAASILQAVVNQTIGGLACGKPIRGNVAFLGGPLYFLPELKNRFIESLNMDWEAVISPDNAQLFVAIGAALLSSQNSLISFGEIIDKIMNISNRKDKSEGQLGVLFKDDAEYMEFKRRHSLDTVKKADIVEYQGKAYLGIDAGSTTTKIALIGEHAELLYSFYGSNEGNPMKRIVSILTDMYEQFHDKIKIAHSAVTGYGEALMKAALHVDVGEIETIAHYKAAEYFLPGVDFILDIGGQDMKCMRIKNGAIDSILLNEACSSGCGSFLEGFAESLNMSVEDFAKSAIFAKSPMDLGSKCTVFMNSKVKQSQKEGAEIADLSAGLSYSIIKNALYKVIKIRNDKDMGQKIIVQGGTFYNDAVLRSFELISGREVVRPEIAGLMGAFGAALIARERWEYRNIQSTYNLVAEKSSILSKEELHTYHIESSFKRCESCENHCLLTINKFSNSDIFIAGNRCDRGLGLRNPYAQLPNLYHYKYQRTFQYSPRKLEDAKRGIIGIPRVLNMYENYPFWFTLLTKLDFRVIVSDVSSKKLYQKGIETIPSESACYPAKLCHGHIVNLIEKGIKIIFYPSVVYEQNEFEDATNHYNCPIVASYPEVIKNNMDDLEINKIKLITPFLSLNNDKILIKRIMEEFSEYNVTQTEVKKAVQAAMRERDKYKKDIQDKGEEVLEYLETNNVKGIVLCGKPYHIDPEINHGIPEIIQSYGFAVLTEDSISHIAPLKNKLRVVDQWVYNSRLYRAASLVSTNPKLDLIQLNSFGCGLDAITTDQVAEILAMNGKLYTMLKIDEGNNLGAAKIRIRSLKAVIDERERIKHQPEIETNTYQYPIFTKKMKKEYTILSPQMSPVHFELIQEATRACGYHLVVLPANDPLAVEEGLKYVNNDACYPAIIVVGQLISALKSGEYDLNHTAVIISQTGGGCRATNYIGFLKMGLKQAGFAQIHIISLNAVGLEKQPGFKIFYGLINRCIMALIYGDLFMRVLNRTRPYEMIKGSAENLYKKWNEEAKINVNSGNRKEFNKNVKLLVSEFDQLVVCEIEKPKVGIVGEILLKYHPTANNDIIGILEQGGAEVIIPDLLDFFLYCTFNSNFKYHYLGGKRVIRDLNEAVTFYLQHYRKVMQHELANSKRFSAPNSIEKLAEKASSILSLGNQTGEGWLITAEMAELMEGGVKNIVCIQPLACLPNHITGKGMFKPLKVRYPDSNIVPIDYDPGISQVNQLNRIKLMLSVAKNNWIQDSDEFKSNI